MLSRELWCHTLQGFMMKRHRYGRSYGLLQLLLIPKGSSQRCSPRPMPLCNHDLLQLVTSCQECIQNYSKVVSNLGLIVAVKSALCQSVPLLFSTSSDEVPVDIHNYMYNGSIDNLWMSGLSYQLPAHL